MVSQFFKARLNFLRTLSGGFSSPILLRKLNSNLGLYSLSSFWYGASFALTRCRSVFGSVCVSGIISSETPSFLCVFVVLGCSSLPFLSCHSGRVIPCFFSSVLKGFPLNSSISFAFLSHPFFLSRSLSGFPFGLGSY